MFNNVDDLIRMFYKQEQMKKTQYYEDKALNEFVREERREPEPPKKEKKKSNKNKEEVAPSSDKKEIIELQETIKRIEDFTPGYFFGINHSDKELILKVLRQELAKISSDNPLDSIPVPTPIAPVKTYTPEKEIFYPGMYC